MTQLEPSGARPTIGDHRWTWTPLLPLLGIAVGAVCGWVTFSLTRPTEGELQRAVLHEVGLPQEIESAPVIGPVLDAYTDRVSRRVVQESRGSTTLALAVSVTAAAAVSTIPHVAWRRRTATRQRAVTPPDSLLQ